MGSAQILSLVEDALSVGQEGTGQFTLNAVPVNLRRDILERTWASIRLQKRFAEKLKSIAMELEVAEDVPERAVVDPTRVAMVITNLARCVLRFSQPQ